MTWRATTDEELAALQWLRSDKDPALADTGNAVWSVLSNEQPKGGKAAWIERVVALALALYRAEQERLAAERERLRGTPPEAPKKKSRQWVPCDCGKRGYPSQHVARRHMSKAGNRVRCYLCGLSGTWHITSQKIEDAP